MGRGREGYSPHPTTQPANFIKFFTLCYVNNKISRKDAADFTIFTEFAKFSEETMTWIFLVL